MIDISTNGIITMNRGDYGEFPLFINQGNNNYPIRYSLDRDKSEATIIFALMTFNQDFDNAFLKKVYDARSFTTGQNDVKIIFKPEDTQNLMPGKYFYGIRHVRILPNGQICQHMLVSKRLFFIKE